MRHWPRRLCALSNLIACLLFGALDRTAHAEERGAPSSLELVWDAPAQCPSRESLLTNLSLALGESRSAEKVHARARIGRDASGAFVLTLGIRSGNLDNDRTVRDPSCDVVAAAAVVMLLLAIDPARAFGSDPTSPNLEEKDAPLSNASPTDQGPAGISTKPARKRGPLSAPKHRRKAARRFVLGTGVAPIADFGTFGRPAMGALATFYASFVERLRAEVGFVAWTPVQVTLKDAPSLGIRLAALGANVRGCFLPIMRGRTELGACAAVDLTTANASGFGTRERRSDQAMWFAVGGGLIGRERLSRTVHFVGAVYGTLPLEGPQYGVQIGDEARRIHRISFGVRVALGVELALF